MKLPTSASKQRYLIEKENTFNKELWEEITTALSKEGYEFRDYSLMSFHEPLFQEHPYLKDTWVKQLSFGSHDYYAFILPGTIYLCEIWTHPGVTWGATEEEDGPLYKYNYVVDWTFEDNKSSFKEAYSNMLRHHEGQKAFRHDEMLKDMEEKYKEKYKFYFGSNP